MSLKIIFVISISLIIFQIPLSNSNEQLNTKFYPIIIVPGDGGSRAYSKNLRTNVTSLIWFSLEYMLLPQYLKNEFIRRYNISTGETTDNRGFKVKFPGWGSTENVENLNSWNYAKTAYFQRFVAELVKNPFYIRNKTLRAAPYDFRRAPYENHFFMKNFPKLVQETFENSNNSKVVIIAHSLGSLYVLHCLKNMDESWKRTYLKAFVSTAAPIGGSIKALLLEISGSSFGIPRNPLIFRDIERSFSSTAYLLPRPNYFPSNQLIVQTRRKNYTAFDYYSLFKDIGFETGYRMYQSSMKYFDANEALNGVQKVFCLHGINVLTPNLIKYPLKFPDFNPQIEYGNGDGSVNINSLKACTSWKGVSYVTISNVNHKDILSNPWYINFVRRISKNTIHSKF